MAARANPPGLVIGRGADWTKYELGGGKYQLISRRASNHRPDPFGRPDNFAETRPGFVPDGPNAYASVQQAFPVRIPRVANATKTVTVRGMGSTTVNALDVAASHAQIAEDGSYATYPDAWEDVDWVLCPTTRGLKEVFVLKGPEHPELMQFSIRGSQNFSYALDEVGDLAIYADGSRVGKIARPNVIIPGAMPHETIRHGALDWDGSTLTVLLPDLTGLEYPIEVDPTVEFNPDANAESSSVDGYTWEGITQTSFANARSANGAGYNDSATYNYLGTSRRGVDWEDMWRAQFAFDTSSIGAGYVVTDATFYAKRLGMIGTDIYWGLSTHEKYSSHTRLYNQDHNLSQMGSTNCFTGWLSYSAEPGTQDLNDAGKAHIDMEGLTSFCGRCKDDILDTTPTVPVDGTAVFRQWVSERYPSQPLPELAVTYEAAGGGVGLFMNTYRQMGLR